MRIMIMRVQIPNIPSNKRSLILIRIYPPTIDPRRPRIAQMIPIFLSTFPARAKLYRPERSVPRAQTFAVAIAWLGVIPKSVKSGIEIRALPHPALPIILQRRPIKKMMMYVFID